MSHEIRTPMTAILGFSDIILGNVKDRQNIDAIKTIQRNGNYLLGPINDILDLSKIESGKLEVELTEFSPCEVLVDVVSLMRVRATAKGLPLEIEFDGPIPNRIVSDPTRLRQILINLTGNAIKFTELGKVRLVVRLVDADSEFHADQGRGADATEGPQIARLAGSQRHENYGRGVKKAAASVAGLHYRVAHVAAAAEVAAVLMTNPRL